RLGQRTVRQVEAFEPTGAGGVRHVAFQADLRVPVLAPRQVTHVGRPYGRRGTRVAPQADHRAPLAARAAAVAYARACTHPAAIRDPLPVPFPTPPRSDDRGFALAGTLPGRAALPAGSPSPSSWWRWRVAAGSTRPPCK